MTETIPEKTVPQVVFHTNTDIDPRSWRIMGLHAKETDSPIGHFGTGLKYCIAILLRTGHEVTIHNNGKVYRFALSPAEFRGKEFQMITCNGEELPFTTEYGKNWGLEGAYRELVSNTMDEGGLHFAGEPMEDGTSIVVRGKDFHELLGRHNEFFIGDREPLYVGKSVSIYEGEGTIFYRGVKIGSIERAGFSYEIHDETKLTEDRTAANVYDVYFKIMKCICTELDDRSLIRRILTQHEGKWEMDDSRDYDWTWSKEFSDTVKEIWETTPHKLPRGVRNRVRIKLPDIEFKMLDRPEYTEPIAKAREFLEKAGYPVSEEIVIVDNSDSVVIAFVHNGKIHLTERAFDKGLFDLVTTLFEEQMHLNGHNDECRSFQQFLINQIITQARKRLNVVL